MVNGQFVGYACRVLAQEAVGVERADEVGNHFLLVVVEVVFGYLCLQLFVERHRLPERQPFCGVFGCRGAREQVVGRFVVRHVVGQCVGFAVALGAVLFLPSVEVFVALLLVIALFECFVFEQFFVYSFFEVLERQFQKVHLQKLLRCERLRLGLGLGLYEFLRHVFCLT